MNTQSSLGIVATAMFSALAAQCLNTAQSFQQLYIAPPAEQSVEQQIKHANCFWRQQLGMSLANTIEARECLIDHCDLQDWVRWFSTGVVPTIIALGLPKAQEALQAEIA